MQSLTAGRQPDPVLTGLRLDAGPLLGRVTRLDPNRLEVELADPALINRVTVADLVALPNATGFLIGLVDSVGRASTRRGHAPPEGTLGDGAPVELVITPVGTFHWEDGNAEGTFARDASVYPYLGESCHLIEGELLHGLMSSLGGGVGPEERLVLGHYLADPDSPAVADGNRLFQRHAALLGSTGAGKSWSVALLLERASRLRHANVIVFDLHGEYSPLTESSLGRDPVARGLRVAGPADLGRESPDLLHLPYWLLERDELMTLVQNSADPHAPDQAFRFTEHVQTLKQISLVDAGRQDAIATFTPDSPIPYRLNHLVQMLKADDTETIIRHPNSRLDPGPYKGRLTGFISRVEALAANPRYGFIFNPPERTLRYEWLSETATMLLQSGPGRTGIKVIDLSEVPSDVVPLVAGVLARLVHEVQVWIDPDRRTPLSIVCDEAHLYLPTREDGGPIHRAALQAFEAIAKEGRKYGVALIVVSQRPSDVSRTILSQCNNFVIMRVTNDHDRAMIEQLMPESLSGLTGVLPALDVGEAMIIGDALLLPSRVRIDPPAIAPASTTQPYWSMWANQPSSNDAIAAGAEALRNQYRAENR